MMVRRCDVAPRENQAEGSGNELDRGNRQIDCPKILRLLTSYAEEIKPMDEVTADIERDCLIGFNYVREK